MDDEEVMAKLIKLVVNHARETHATISTADLTMLVRFAVIHGEITLGKARELLGLQIMEIRALADVWGTQCEHDVVIIPGEEG